MIVVTDHALVRCLERGHDIDMEWFRRRIACDVERAIEAAKPVIGDKPFAVVRDGMVYRIQGGVVVTCWPRSVI